MEELAGGLANEVSSGFDVGNLMGTGAIGAIGIAALFIFLNWKSSGLKSIKTRAAGMITKKEEIAHEILANDKRQVQLNTTIEKTGELTKEQEEKIAEITEKAAQDIKESLQGTDPRATVNSIRKKWNN